MKLDATHDGLYMESRCKFVLFKYANSSWTDNEIKQPENESENTLLSKR